MPFLSRETLFVISCLLSYTTISFWKGKISVIFVKEVSCTCTSISLQREIFCHSVKIGNFYDFLFKYMWTYCFLKKELFLPFLSREIFFVTSCLLSCQSISFCKRRFSAIFVKRDNFCDVLFAYMCIYCLLLKVIFLTFLANKFYDFLLAFMYTSLRLQGETFRHFSQGRQRF